jgi:hypothetical protein
VYTTSGAGDAFGSNLVQMNSKTAIRLAPSPATNYDWPIKTLSTVNDVMIYDAIPLFGKIIYPSATAYSVTQRVIFYWQLEWEKTFDHNLLIKGPSDCTFSTEETNLTLNITGSNYFDGKTLSITGSTSGPASRSYIKIDCTRGAIVSNRCISGVQDPSDSELCFVPYIPFNAKLTKNTTGAMIGVNVINPPKLFVKVIKN